jgi:hypothetical protein
MIWFIIMTIVMGNGDVYTEVRPATDPKYNNEQTCLEAGKILTDQKQIEIGTNAGKVYYVCQSFSETEINKALGKTGSSI